MNANYLSVDLSEFRRQLEEILALLSRDVDRDSRSDPHRPSLNPDVSVQGFTGRNASASPNQSDELFDKALAVITEFGQTSPAILQMWLGIDYARAMALLYQFEAQGIISSKGRVRHKAYELRRSRGQEQPA